MTGSPAFLLTSANARVTIHPAEGAVAADLQIDGLSVLARTPWSDDVEPSSSPALHEEEWVRRWRGGWQLCFPTAGQPDPAAHPRQSFHGTASQAPWRVEAQTSSSATLSWEDEAGLRARRTWQLDRDALHVSTTAINAGDRARVLVVAEHLVLGDALLAPVLAGTAATVHVPDGAVMRELDYAGLPTGGERRWPGDPGEEWGAIRATTPARVVALSPPTDTTAELVVADRRATVTWRGLPHLLLWEELARSSDAPWDGRVVAVGIEPTSTPHGGGTAAGGGIDLAPGADLRWSTTLRVGPVAGHRHERREEG